MTWVEVRLAYRKSLRRVIDDIAAGTVGEADLDKLNNFCMTAVMLMGKVSESVWRKAERDAELKAWLHGDVQDRTMEAPHLYSRSEAEAGMLGASTLSEIEMKFRYYITNTLEGVLEGTDSEDVAENFAECEDYFVVDTRTGEWMQPGYTREEVKDAEAEHGR